MQLKCHVGTPSTRTRSNHERTEFIYTFHISIANRLGFGHVSQTNPALQCRPTFPTINVQAISVQWHFTCKINHDGKKDNSKTFWFGRKINLACLPHFSRHVRCARSVWCEITIECGPLGLTAARHEWHLYLQFYRTTIQKTEIYFKTKSSWVRILLLFTESAAAVDTIRVFALNCLRLFYFFSTFLLAVCGVSRMCSFDRCREMTESTGFGCTNSWLSFAGRVEEASQRTFVANYIGCPSLCLNTQMRRVRPAVPTSNGARRPQWDSFNYTVYGPREWVGFRSFNKQMDNVSRFLLCQTT